MSFIIKETHTSNKISFSSHERAKTKMLDDTPELGRVEENMHSNDSTE